MKKLVILALWAVICHTGIAAAEQTADVDAAEGPFPLTLADSIAMALATNERIDAAEAGREAAAWNLSGVRRATGPVVAWNAEGHRGAQKGLFGLTDYNSYAHSWSLTIPFYTGGRNEGRIEQGRYQLNRADLNLENARQTVRFKTAEAYANLLYRKDLAAIAQRAVDMADHQMQLIKAQYEEGAVARADVLAMEVQLANYRQNLVTAKGAVDVAMDSLASLIGLPLDAEIQPTDIFSSEAYPQDMHVCEEYALQHRPDYLAAIYAEKVAKAQMDTEKAGYRPQVSGSVKRQISSGKALFGTEGGGWDAGVQVAWNIFDNGVTQAGVQKAAATVTQSQAETEAARKTVCVEIRNAYIEMKAAEESIADSSAAVETAEECYEIAQVRYDEGVDNLLALNDAQEKFNRAQSNYCTALYQYNLRRVTLEKAMGVPVRIDPARYVAAEQQGASSAKALAEAELAPATEEDAP